METAFWITWWLAIAVTLFGWLAIHTVVQFIVRKVILLVLLEQKFAAGADKISISIAELDLGAAQIEDAIISNFRFPPLRWLVKRAVDDRMEWFLGSIRSFAAERGVSAIEGPLLGAWMHSIVATKAGEFSGDIASKFMRWAFFAICFVGIAAFFGFR